jgi:hypothetical protein
MSANPAQVQYTFSTAELWLLLAQFKPRLALGLTDPYASLPRETAEALARRTAQALRSRGLVQPTAGGPDRLDPVLQALLQTLAHPTHSLVVQFQSPAVPNQRSFLHLAGAEVLEHAPLPGDQQRLTRLPGRAALTAHLAEVLRQGSPARGQGAPFEITGAILTQARFACAAQRCDDGASTLRRANLPEETVARLLDALTNISASASILCLAHPAPDAPGQPAQIGGLALLEGAGELWLIEVSANTEAPVRFIPAAPADIEARFLSLLPA